MVSTSLVVVGGGVRGVDILFLGDRRACRAALALGETFDRIEASGPFEAASSTAASLDAAATKDIASPSFIVDQHADKQRKKREKKKKNHVYVNFIVDHFSVRKIADTFADQSCTVRGVTDVSTTKQNDSIESISYRSINVHVTKFPDSIRTFTVYILYLFVSHVSR